MAFYPMARCLYQSPSFLACLHPLRPGPPAASAFAVPPSGSTRPCRPPLSVRPPDSDPVMPEGAVIPPLPDLPPPLPPPQFAIHMASLLAAIHLAAPHTRPGWVCGPDSVNGTAARDAGEPAPPCPGPCAVPEGAGAGAGCGGCVGGPCISDRDPDAGFSPSVLNSAVFLATRCQCAPDGCACACALVCSCVRVRNSVTVFARSRARVPAACAARSAVIGSARSPECPARFCTPRVSCCFPPPRSHPCNPPPLPPSPPALIPIPAPPRPATARAGA